MMVWVVVAGHSSRRLIPRCVVVGSFFVEETRQKKRERKDSEREGKREKRGTEKREGRSKWICLRGLRKTKTKRMIQISPSASKTATQRQQQQRRRLDPQSV